MDPRQKTLLKFTKAHLHDETTEKGVQIDLAEIVGFINHGERPDADNPEGAHWNDVEYLLRSGNSLRFESSGDPTVILWPPAEYLPTDEEPPAP